MSSRAAHHSKSRRVRPYAAAALAVLGIAAATIAARAYTTNYKWASTPVLFYMNPANSDVDPAMAEAAVQGALNAWSSNSSFRYQYAGRVSDTSTANDGRNVLIFRNVDNGGTIASTYSWTWNGVRVDSDIVMWDGGWTFFTGTTGCSSGAYIEDIATHELGHALGLGHSSVLEATMYSSYARCSQNMRTPSSDDIAGLQKLYGSSGSTSSNTAPSISIASPLSGMTATAGQSISFVGSATDSQDGSLTSRISWRSSVDGSLGTGGSLTRGLTAGSHVITASVTDSGGLSKSAQVTVTVTSIVTNTAPSVLITTPQSGTSLTAGQAVSFSGSATDSQDGSLTSAISWRSSVDGALGTGGSFSRGLSAGSHLITATVTDSGGLAGSAQVSVTVTSSTPTNTAPTVLIGSPLNGTSAASGQSISFSGSATDSQDGNLTSALSWRSSIDGSLGAGGSFTRSLSPGSHVITATVTDSGGYSGSSQVTVTVAQPSSTVTSPSLNANGYKIKGVKRVDLRWNGVSSTAIDVYRNGSRVMTTANDGAETDPIDTKGGGSYTYRVCAAGSSTICSNLVAVPF